MSSSEAATRRSGTPPSPVKARRPAVRWLLLSLVVVLGLLPVGAAADWPTYHQDLSRSGHDATAPVPSLVEHVWTTNLDGPVYAEPLVAGNLVLIATENNTIYALDVASGTIAWRSHLAPSVPSNQFPCGNINPVGITGTPTVDVANGVLYAVAQTWTAPTTSTVHYELYAVDLNSGAALWHEQVLAAGTARFDPLVQGQRSALALNGGTVDIPFGGRSGDCGFYHGWVAGAAAARSGPGAIASFVLPTPNAGDHEGGFWAPSGAAIDASNNVYVTSGNTACSGTCPGFNYGESVIKLSSSLQLLDYFAPSNFASLNGSDTDLGSLGPSLLPNNLIFQVGKEGIGFLLSTASPGGSGHNTPLASARVCSRSADAAFGGTAYDSAKQRLFIPCIDRLEAVDVGFGTPPTLTPVAGWSTPGVSYSGPPIVAGGLVWTIDPNGTLYALDEVTGSVTFSANIGGAQHFATPTSGAGRIFVPAGSAVQAFRLPWNRWASLGGLVTSSPDASSWGSGHIDLFARGGDNALWHRSFDGTTWSAWSSLGGQISSDPSAVSQANGSIDVFAKGTDNALWHRSFTGSWGPWGSLGGGLIGGPDASSWGSGRVDVFIRGLDNAIWHLAEVGTSWGTWESLGGLVTSDPTAVSQTTNSINLFARGGDNALWHRPYSGSWGAWQSLGGSLSSGPDAASWGAGRVDVFARGGDLALWHRAYASGWSDWESLGGQLTSDPSAVSSGVNRIDVFGRGGDNAIWHRIYSG